MSKIVIGNDHGGYQYKILIKEYLIEHGFEVIDVGSYNEDSVDYPDIARLLSDVVVEQKIRGILVCGTGIGISIAANKCHGIRCALCNDEYSASKSVQHNNSNVLAVGQRVLGEGLVLNIVATWLNAEFEGGRHLTRVNKITGLE